MQRTLNCVKCMCLFEGDFPIQSAMRRDELFPNWARYEHDFDVAKQVRYDEQHFDLAEQDVIYNFYDRD